MIKALIYLSLYSTIFTLQFNWFHTAVSNDPVTIFEETNTEKCYNAVGKYFHGTYTLEEEKAHISSGSMYAYDDVKEELYTIQSKNKDSIELTKTQYFKAGKVVLVMQTCHELLTSNKKIFNHIFEKIKTPYLSEPH